MRDHRQRPDREGRRQQPVDGQEDLPRLADRRGEPAADGQPGRVRRRRPADPEGDLHPGRQAVPRPHPALGRAASRPIALVFGNSTAGGAYVPGHVRLHGDGQGAGEGVPRRPAAGEDGDRRGVRRRVARRRRDARPGLRARRLPRRGRARRDPHRPPDRGPAQLAQARPAPPRVAGPSRTHDPDELLGIDPDRPQGAVRPARGDRADRRRRLPTTARFDEFKPLYGSRWSPAGRSSTATRSASSPTTACCSPRRRRRRRSSSSSPTRSTPRCCSCRTPPATWSARSTSRAASSSTARR